MKANGVWNAVNKIDGKDIPKSEKLVLSTIVEDIGKMEERITNLDKKVDCVEKKVDTLQISVEQLSKLVEEYVKQQRNTTILLSDLIKNKWFWFWFIIFTIIIGGGSISELANIVHIGG